MKLKGIYSADESYNIGDVVLYDGVVYHLQKPAIPGATPKETLCWGRLNQPLAEAVMLILDGVDMARDEIEKYFLNDQTLLLKTGEGDSETTYAITVDDSGDTPELAVEEVTDGD